MTRSVLRVGVQELRRRPGTQRHVALSTPLPGLAISSAGVPDDAEIRIDATLEAIEGGVTATGTVTAPWVGECRRCLGEVHGTMEAPVGEVFEPHPTEGETYPLEGDEVDLEPVVRDAVLLSLPLAPLCREDCAGPDPEAFPTGPAAADDGADVDVDGPVGDPRWAALSELRLEDD